MKFNRETIVTIVGWDKEWRWSGKHRGEPFGSDDPATSMDGALDKAQAEMRAIEQKVSTAYYAEQARLRGDAA